MAVNPVTEANFDEEVIKSKIPVLIDYWAEWCGPCRMMASIYEETSRDYNGKVKFVKINTDENQNLAVKYNIMSIPTTMLVKDGKVKAMQVGAVPKETLKKWIEKNL